MDKPIVSFEGVSYAYPGGEPVFEDFSFEVFAGDFLLVAGSSGAGKSTLVRMINGLVPHYSGGSFAGNVISCGMNTRVNSTRDMAGRVGLVFQDPESQFIMDSVLGELRLGCESRGFDPALIDERVEKAIREFSLEGLIGRRVETLSGGEKQRAILAGIMAFEPEVLVLDEPTSQLDPAMARDFFGFLKAINEGGTTVIISEHRVERLLGLATRVLDLDRKAGGLTQEMVGGLEYKPAHIVLGEEFLRRGWVREVPLCVEEAGNAFSGFCMAGFGGGEGARGGGPVIRVRDLVKDIGGRRVLDGVSFDVRGGAITAIVGVNGSGKTTLVKHFNALLKPDGGQVIVDGVDTRDSCVSSLSKTVGYVSQNPNEYLFSDTVGDELLFTLACQGKRGDVGGTLDLVGLRDKAGVFPRDMSGGERQLTAIAAILVGRPKVIIFDEPTRGVDHRHKMMLMDIMEDLVGMGGAVIIVSHDIETLAGRVDDIILLEDGKVRDSGSARDVFTRNSDFAPIVTQLFGGGGFIGVDEVLKSL
jgi:energy-coupling factor transport system ATP-binding protein